VEKALAGSPFQAVLSDDELILLTPEEALKFWKSRMDQARDR
jgi:hypothetical protein